jgi:hypothetical protein
VPAIRYRSWREFTADFRHELFDDGVFRRGSFLFRGVARAEWRLESTFDRRYTHVPAGEREALARQLLNGFRSECDSHNVPSEVLSDDVSTLALGQHFGLPTRLLDWSDSPYVAAFFAFASGFTDTPAEHPTGSRGDVAIWVLDRALASSERFPDVEVVRLRTVGNIRLQAQGGSFTRLRSEDVSLDAAAERLGSAEAPILRQLVLPAVEFETAIADLDVMGINHARIFPDLGGAAAATIVRVALEGRGGGGRARA